MKSAMACAANPMKKPSLDRRPPEEMTVVCTTVTVTVAGMGCVPVTAPAFVSFALVYPKFVQ